MISKHKCKNPGDLLDLYVNDGNDPSNVNIRLNRKEIGFDINNYLKNLNLAQNAFIEHNKTIKPQAGILYSKEEALDGGFHEVNSRHSKNRSNKSKASNMTQQNLNKSQVTNYLQYFFNAFVELQKCITKKILQLKIIENEVKIPKYIQYKLSIIISNLDFEDMVNLKHVTNFGIEFQMIELMINSFKCDISREKRVAEAAAKVDFDKLLIIYKYIQICNVKCNGGFYKKEEEEINDCIYNEFVLKEQDKFKKSALTFSTPTYNSQPSISNSNNTNKSKLTFLLNSKIEESGRQTPFNYDANIYSHQQLKGDSKLSKLLSSAHPQPKVEVKKTQKPKKFQGINEDDFPELK